MCISVSESGQTWGKTNTWFVVIWKNDSTVQNILRERKKTSNLLTKFGCPARLIDEHRWSMCKPILVHLIDFCESAYQLKITMI